MHAILQAIDLNKRTSQWIILCLLALIWGSSFILMKRGLISFSHTQVAAIRIFFTFLFLLPSAIKRLSRVKRAHIRPLLVVAFFGNAIPAFLFTKAQTEVCSSMAGILNALTPLFALVVGVLVYKVRFVWHNLFGVFIGLAGAVALVFIQSGFGLSEQNLYPLYILLATIFYAFSVNEIKQNLAGLDGVTIIAVAFVFVGPLSGVILLNSDFSTAISNPAFFESISAIVILAMFGSAIATIIFNYLVYHTNALFAASAAYLIPIVAVFWGVLDGESVVIGQIPAIGLILLGIYLVNKKN
jgi:drug/metabolite transporter (DMT)-like permease